MSDVQPGPACAPVSLVDLAVLGRWMDLVILKVNLNDSTIPAWLLGSFVRTFCFALLMLRSVIQTQDPSVALASCKHGFGLPVKAITRTEVGPFEDHIGGENGESWGR